MSEPTLPVLDVTSLPSTLLLEVERCEERHDTSGTQRWLLGKGPHGRHFSVPLDATAYDALKPLLLNPPAMGNKGVFIAAPTSGALDSVTQGTLQNAARPLEDQAVEAVVPRLYVVVTGAAGLLESLSPDSVACIPLTARAVHLCDLSQEMASFVTRLNTARTQRIEESVPPHAPFLVTWSPPESGATYMAAPQRAHLNALAEQPLSAQARAEAYWPDYVAYLKAQDCTAIEAHWEEEASSVSQALKMTWRTARGGGGVLRDEGGRLQVGATEESILMETLQQLKVRLGWSLIVADLHPSVSTWTAPALTTYHQDITESELMPTGAGSGGTLPQHERGAALGALVNDVGGSTGLMWPLRWMIRQGEAWVTEWLSLAQPHDVSPADQSALQEWLYGKAPVLQAHIGALLKRVEAQRIQNTPSQSDLGVSATPVVQRRASSEAWPRALASEMLPTKALLEGLTWTPEVGPFIASAVTRWEAQWQQHLADHPFRAPKRWWKRAPKNDNHLRDYELLQHNHAVFRREVEEALCAGITSTPGHAGWLTALQACLALPQPPQKAALKGESKDKTFRLDILKTCLKNMEAIPEAPWREWFTLLWTPSDTKTQSGAYWTQEDWENFAQVLIDSGRHIKEAPLLSDRPILFTLLQESILSHMQRGSAAQTHEAWMPSIPPQQQTYFRQTVFNCNGWSASELERGVSLARGNKTQRQRNTIRASVCNTALHLAKASQHIENKGWTSWLPLWMERATDLVPSESHAQEALLALPAFGPFNKPDLSSTNQALLVREILEHDLPFASHLPCWKGWQTDAALSFMLFDAKVHRVNHVYHSNYPQYIKTFTDSLSSLPWIECWKQVTSAFMEIHGASLERQVLSCFLKSTWVSPTTSFVTSKQDRINNAPLFEPYLRALAHSVDVPYMLRLRKYAQTQAAQAFDLLDTVFSLKTASFMKEKPPVTLETYGTDERYLNMRASFLHTLLVLNATSFEDVISLLKDSRPVSEKGLANHLTRTLVSEDTTTSEKERLLSSKYTP